MKNEAQAEENDFVIEKENIFDQGIDEISNSGTTTQVQPSKCFSVFRSESEQHPPMVTQLIVITLESHYYLSDYLRNQTPCFVDISDKIHVLKS